MFRRYTFIEFEVKYLLTVTKMLVEVILKWILKVVVLLLLLLVVVIIILLISVFYIFSV